MLTENILLNPPKYVPPRNLVPLTRAAELPGPKNFHAHIASTSNEKNVRSLWTIPPGNLSALIFAFYRLFDFFLSLAQLKSYQLAVWNIFKTVDDLILAFLVFLVHEQVSFRTQHLLA